MASKISLLQEVAALVFDVMMDIFLMFTDDYLMEVFEKRILGTFSFWTNHPNEELIDNFKNLICRLDCLYNLNSLLHTATFHLHLLACYTNLTKCYYNCFSLLNNHQLFLLLEINCYHD